MAKKRKENLTPNDQVLYDSLSPAFKQIVDRIKDPIQKSATIRDLAAQASAQAAATATTATTATAFSGGTAGTQDSFVEPAIGVEAVRRVSLGTQQVVPGTATRVGGVGGFVPRYFERDKDLLSRYSRDQVADIQAKMQKAGLLGNKYRIGIPDDATKNAWEELLGLANNTNVDWTTALQIAQKQPIGATAKLPPKVSNPADIAKVVQQVAGKVLGRSVEQQFIDGIVRQFQASQVQSQTGALPMADGRRVDPMDLQVLAEQRLRRAAGPEAEAYRFAQAAARVFGAAGSGAGVETGEVAP